MFYTCGPTPCCLSPYWRIGIISLMPTVQASRDLLYLLHQVHRLQLDLEILSARLTATQNGNLLEGAYSERQYSSVRSVMASTKDGPAPDVSLETKPFCESLFCHMSLLGKIYRDESDPDRRRASFKNSALRLCSREECQVYGTFDSLVANLCL